MNRKIPGCHSFPIFAAMAVYETVVGLEVHIQLLTQSKLFCADPTGFGASPNTQVSVVSLAHPGTLPVLNEEAVDMAVKLGLVLHSEIAEQSHFDRKHYFYPDLPKGYQTSQLTDPILNGGYLEITTAEGTRSILINHVHLEEDAGKSIHDLDPDFSKIDLNRAGMPLLELVTEPVIRTGDEAYEFLAKLRKLVRWTGICDGNMEEGSLRCDANISVRPMGERKLGTRVEIKNLNSIRHVKRAIEAEAERQIALLENGEAVTQETRGFDAQTQQTIPQREKENANDYRYFPCPDIPPFTVSAEKRERLAAGMPELPAALRSRLQQEFSLSAQDAEVLTDDKELADYFLALVQEGAPPKPAANWMQGPVKSWLNVGQKTLSEFPLPPAALNGLIQLVQSGKVNFSMAASRLMPALMENSGANAETLAMELGIIQHADSGELKTWAEAVLEKMPDKVKAYKGGKKGLMGLFVGEVKKLSKGQADPKKTTEILEELLKD